MLLEALFLTALAVAPSAPTGFHVVDVAVMQTGTTWKVEFTPSADHPNVDNAGAPIVAKYELAVTNGTVTVRQDLGKPACPANLCIVDVNALILPLPAGSWTASVVAIGPGGTSPPATSDPFTLQGPTRAPTAAGKPRLGRS